MDKRLEQMKAKEHGFMCRELHAYVHTLLLYNKSPQIFTGMTETYLS